MKVLRDAALRARLHVDMERIWTFTIYQHQVINPNLTPMDALESLQQGTYTLGLTKIYIPRLER